MVSPVTVLLPTAYFPPVSYFAHLIRSTSGFIEQMETFPKQTYRNRCEILTSAGKHNLVVPVTKPNGNHTLTKDIEICYREPWRELQYKTLQTAYSSSPFFTYYKDILQPLFESGETHLIRHNHKIINVILGLIGTELNCSYTQDYEKKPVNILDLRTEISPKRPRIMANFPEYPQVFSHLSGFIPDLSILDLLFNLGPDAVNYIVKVER